MASPSPAIDPQSPWPDRLAWAVLAVIAAIALATFRDYGLGWDDYTHSQYGDLLLALYTSGFRDTRALSFVNLYLYGGGFDMAADLLAKVLPFDLFETRRLAGALVGLIGLAATWRIGRRVGGPLAGLIALILLATCPLYYGHMFINPKDAPFAVAMAVFLLGLIRLLDEYPKPSAATLAIVGTGFGLSIGSRIMAGFGVITAVLSIGLRVPIDTRYRGLRAALAPLRQLLLRLMPAAIIAYAVMALVWPWGVANPLNPISAIDTFSHFFEKPWHELYGGERITPPDMPRSYVLVLMGLKLPEIFSLLAAAGVLGALVAAFRPAVLPRTRTVLLSIALAALLPIAVTVITRPAMYNGIRHFVFVLPPLAVAGGLAGAWIAERASRFGRAASRIVAAIFAVGIALPVIGMARLHPYEYAFFNQLIGGARGAQPLYMLDYWGLALKQAGNALRDTLAARGEAPPAGRKWKIAVCGPHPPARIALGEQFEPTWEPKGADFALSLGTFYCARLDAPVLVEVIRDGVTFARAYDLRGRTVTDLFTE
ncbi:MAG: glycosyltransferase family 39 protein, partial [Xanthobacteraceae bacterium]|nr:glycosyltransferase family 39 protein [Xanthobacteraceae bacterium]